ncbi:efflux RND transporter periplasmic adaptor subunit [Hyphomicrobium sp. CS1GBMeth3]|uniref:efflux RND transporter periplasmic adaptor subunit n=1 Tax=Hyphomicrobium sp. CS1GBMeth3 TaxID=1892845 RepID=UPI000930F12D|nr:efflux RND transporter periplasmic adaptor subunit [Hyphomicrobium sp. CS1GBMeth3]
MSTTSTFTFNTRRLPRAGFTAGAFVVLAAGLSGCKSESAPYVAAPQPVRAASVTISTPTESRSYTGTVKPRYESDLGFRVAGKIVARLINVGDRVTPGMTLARLDAADYRLSLESAEAELKAAQSNLKQAEADETRYADLNKKSWVSDASYDQKKAAADEARGRAERALRSLSLAQNQLAYTDLIATEAGVVTALPVEVGQVVSAGQLIARVARLDELEAVVSIPEGRIDADRAAAATVTLWADSDRVYKAKLREISPQADAATRTYQARYSLLDPNSAITLGKTATVHLASAGHGERATLPLAAVFKDQGQPSVWLIDEKHGRVVKTGVEVSAWTETSAIISGGLAAGQKVVAAGVHKLDAGIPVRIVEVLP